MQLQARVRIQTQWTGPVREVVLPLVVNKNAIRLSFTPSLGHRTHQPPMLLWLHCAHCKAFTPLAQLVNCALIGSLLPRRIMCVPVSVLPDPHQPLCEVRTASEKELRFVRDRTMLISRNYDHWRGAYHFFIWSSWKSTLVESESIGLIVGPPENPTVQLRRNNKHRREVAWNSG